MKDVQRLFIYGSLQPDGPNHHVMADIPGQWSPATIQGELVSSGWGADLGYPGLATVGDGPQVPGYVLTSLELEEHWPRLDAFEGEQYERVIATVTLTNEEQLKAFVYILKPN